MDDTWWDTGYISGIGPEQPWPGPVQILSLRACIWAMYRPGIGPYMAILGIQAIRPIWAVHRICCIRDIGYVRYIAVYRPITRARAHAPAV